MRRYAGILLAGLILLASATGCGADYSKRYTERAGHYYGAVSSGHYENPWLSMQMDVPAQWHLGQDPMRAEVMAAGESVKSEARLTEALAKLEKLPVYNLLQVFRNPPEETAADFNPSLLIMAEPVAGKGVSDGAAYLEASRRVMAGRQMPMGFTQELDGALGEAVFGGQVFAHLPVIIDAGAFTIHQDYYAAKRKDTVLGIVVTWKDEGERLEMMKALDTLKFEE